MYRLSASVMLHNDFKRKKAPAQLCCSAERVFPAIDPTPFLYSRPEADIRRCTP